MILPLLFVPLVYGMSSTPDACAVPPDPNWGKSGLCIEGRQGWMTCCWEEPDILNPGETIQWCQSCQGGDCGEIFRSSSTGPLVLPDEGVVDEGLTPTPTPPPTSPFRPPTSGVFDPPKASPPTGPILTPFPFPVSPTLPIPPTPLTLPPTPPQDDGSGPLNPQGGGILQQPEEVEDPEDEGENKEEDGDQGQETAGPLT